MYRLIIVSIISFVGSAALAAQTATEIAPGGPGQSAHWPSAAKKGFGTANTLASRVWFTLADGVMTEVFYPMMIPEQIWDRVESPRADLRFGAGTGSATPLAWSMAQFIRLAISTQIGHNSETPKVVAARYAKSARAK